jgi:hypothetical protein
LNRALENQVLRPRARLQSWCGKNNLLFQKSPPSYERLNEVGSLSITSLGLPRASCLSVGTQGAASPNDWLAVRGAVVGWRWDCRRCTSTGIPHTDGPKTRDGKREVRASVGGSEEREKKLRPRRC